LLQTVVKLLLLLLFLGALRLDHVALLLLLLAQ
jgi:hypothetical protein